MDQHDHIIMMMVFWLWRLFFILFFQLVSVFYSIVGAHTNTNVYCAYNNLALLDHHNLNINMKSCLSVSQVARNVRRIVTTRVLQHQTGNFDHAARYG
jgi:hypothetical protein